MEAAGPTPGIKEGEEVVVVVVDCIQRKDLLKSKVVLETEKKLKTLSVNSLILWQNLKQQS